MSCVRWVHDGLQLIQERRHFNTAGLDGMYRLLHSEDGRFRRSNGKPFELSTGLETFPCAGDLDEHPPPIGAGLQVYVETVQTYCKGRRLGRNSLEASGVGEAPFEIFWVE